jgi:hypothetical protein
MHGTFSLFIKDCFYMEKDILPSKIFEYDRGRESPAFAAPETGLSGSVSPE